MILKNFKRSAAVLTSVAALGVSAGLIAPQAASAGTARSATSTWNGRTVEAQIDNSPGNGATAWLWLADYNAGNAIAHVTYVDGTTAGWGPVWNTSASASLPKKVSRFQVCFYGNSTYLHCSAWTSM
ncbi:hypothetical protein [Streptomyces sp. NPDC059639]|uniref:hypothetical protein n=1 Tax=Streptomyces sp. NPDC059639 TaxID=3346891 RepID=UPI0036AA71FA